MPCALCGHELAYHADPAVDHRYTEDQPQTAFTVSFGRQRSITFRLAVTNAPPSYDGFGTLTLYDSGAEEGKNRRRYVLIDAQHESWHESRYRSGLFTYERSDALDERDCCERLYKAMLEGLSKLDT